MPLFRLKRPARFRDIRIGDRFVTPGKYGPLTAYKKIGPRMAVREGRLRIEHFGATVILDPREGGPRARFLPSDRLTPIPILWTQVTR